MLDRVDADKEGLLDAESELRALGMDTAVEIIEEYAMLATSRFEEPCPYPDYDRAGHTDWTRRNERKRKEWEAKRDSSPGQVGHKPRLGLVVGMGEGEEMRGSREYGLTLPYHLA